MGASPVFPSRPDLHFSWPGKDGSLGYQLGSGGSPRECLRKKISPLLPSLYLSLLGWDKCPACVSF